MTSVVAAHEMLRPQAQNDTMFDEPLKSKLRWLLFGADYIGATASAMPSSTLHMLRKSLQA